MSLRALPVSLLLFCGAVSAFAATPSEQIRAFLAANGTEARALKNRSEGLALVSISAKFARGTGILFLLDGKPRVLTASHVLAGERSAEASGIFSEKRTVIATVELDLPGEDLAVLALDETGLNTAFLSGVAKANFTACTAAPCTSHADPANKEETLVTSRNGEPVFIRPQNRYALATRASDEYISGSNPFVWLVGAYSRSGVSGGAYYRGPRFAGLVTKVSHGLQSLTVAIPTEGIVASLNSRRGQDARWLPPVGNEPPRLETKIGGLIVLARSSGGDLGNGGDGGAEGPEPRAWNLLMTGCFYCMDDIRRTIENPFLGAENSTPLEIAGRPVSVLAGAKAQAASLPRYRHLLANNARPKLLGTSEAKTLLQPQRSAGSIDLKFFQVWKKQPGNVLENALPMEGNFHDGVIVLLPQMPALGNGMYSPYPTILAPFSEQYWVDFQFPNEKLRFRVARDFSRVELVQAGAERPGNLNAAPFSNPVKSLFRGLSGARALVLFDETNLRVVNAVIIETATRVYQLNRCHPNVGCWLQ